MRWLILIIIIAAVIFYFLGRQQPQQAPPASPPAATAQPETPQPPPAAVIQSTPAPPPAASPVLARMQAVAAQVGVQLRGFQPRQGGAMIALAWPGTNAALGGDFLETCMRQGIIRDFDLNNKREGMATENGQRLFTAQYLVFF